MYAVKLGKLFVYLFSYFIFKLNYLYIYSYIYTNFTLYNNSIYEYVLMLEYGAMKMDVYFCHCIG
ncbi:hypothetical protein PFAG_02542 [Plasmodium falciparum Santa Lucia]|uniref:Uncharacterized protein n=1 Tax=Plasmodium falciparum Santa Lucia TaxID=478859 RepID=W7FWD6_PLAFA|nr:hypothetical protein PFAG_02542 [Plasmodium falciparum Santa Lucia]